MPWQNTAIETGSSDPAGKILINSAEKFPIRGDDLSNPSAWKTQNEVRLAQDAGDTTKDYSLKLDDADKRNAKLRLLKS